jgi:hypothetical protein
MIKGANKLSKKTIGSQKNMGLERVQWPEDLVWKVL